MHSQHLIRLLQYSSHRQDEEGDFCSITSDLELDYVVSNRRLNEYRIIVVELDGSSGRAPVFSDGNASAPEVVPPSAMNASQRSYLIKISCGDQIRRLATRSYSYEALYATIARAFDMPIDSFVLQFIVRDSRLYRCISTNFRYRTHKI
jgi:hypothetical protein